MIRRSVRKLGSTNRYTDGAGRRLDTNALPRDLYVMPISNRAYPQETEHWQVAEAGQPSPYKGRVMISGAGVVGSTTAAMFALRGWHVTVVEQKPSPIERLEASVEAHHRQTINTFATPSSSQDTATSTSPSTDEYEEIDCALLTRRGLDIFAAAGIPLEHLRHFGMKVEGIMEHPSGHNTLLTRNLTEEHRFAVNMLAIDMARLREHLDTHLSRLPGANCKVFYNHQVVAAFPERKKVVVKSLDEIAEKKPSHQHSVDSSASPPRSTDESVPKDTNSTNSMTTIGPSELSPLGDQAKFDGLSYDLLIDAEGPSSRLRDMLDVEGFCSDSAYGIKWFALDEVVEVPSEETERKTFNGEFHRNPKFNDKKSSFDDDASGGYKRPRFEEDEYTGKITQQEKLRILRGEEEKRKVSVWSGKTFRDLDDDENPTTSKSTATGASPSSSFSDESSAPTDNSNAPNERYFYLEKSHIHRWTYPCPKGTKNTALCIAFPRQRSAISTAGNEDNNSNASATAKYRNSYAVMAYFPMSTLRKMSDEEFLRTYLSDLSFERKGFVRASREDEFSTTDGSNSGLGAQQDQEATKRISYFELETPSKPTAPLVAKYSTRGKIISYPTVYCEDLYNGVGLPSAVVVGDAAHCVNPFLLQGLSIGLEDSSILLNHLDAISRHFYDSVKQYSRERGVAGDTLRIITDRSLYYNRAKHYNPFIRLRNAYTKFMFKAMPSYYNEFYSTNMNHLYPRSVEWMLNGRGYTSYEKVEMTQTKLQRWYFLGRNYT